MRADKVALYGAFRDALIGERLPPLFHLLHTKDQDAWQAVEDAAGEHCDGCCCDHCAPHHAFAYESLDATHEALKERVNALRERAERVCKTATSTKLTKQQLIDIIDELKCEIFACDLE